MHQTLVGALLMALSAGALADFFDGKELMARCDSVRADEINTCLGYLAGVSDSDRAAPAWRSQKSLFCVPQGVTASQLRRVLVAYLHQHAEQMEFNASILVGNAFLDAYPCD